MKHLIETADLSGLTRVDYNRIILDSNTDEIVYRGGVNTNGHPYVDLGLPSGTLWATMNVGATSETDYGDYFMWGSTTPNTNTPCNWTNAPFNNRSSNYNETYFSSVKDTVCPNGILAKKYDAAAQIMGGDWRTPTKADFEELLAYTEHRQYSTTSRVVGYEFVASNGKYIFIPLSGYHEGSSTNSQNYNGRVWSSSLNTSHPNWAWTLDFDSDADTVVSLCNTNRKGGYTVRGVL